MIYVQTLEIRGQYIASWTRKAVIYGSVTQPPFGYAFFCPNCCDIWAKAPVTGARTRVLTEPCDSHPHRVSYDPSGSVYVSWDDDYCRDLPKKVLDIELKLHLNMYEKEIVWE